MRAFIVVSTAVLLLACHHDFSSTPDRSSDRAPIDSSHLDVQRDTPIDVKIPDDSRVVLDKKVDQPVPDKKVPDKKVIDQKVIASDTAAPQPPCKKTVAWVKLTSPAVAICEDTTPFAQADAALLQCVNGWHLCTATEYSAILSSIPSTKLMPHAWISACVRRHDDDVST